MSNGFIQQVDVVKHVNTAIYTVTAGRYSEFSLNLLNRTTAPINISIAISNTNNPANNEYIEQGITIPAKTAVVRDGLIAVAGKRVVIQTVENGITATASGIEQIPS